MPSRVHVETADGAMPSHHWLPPSGTGPGLVLLQEIFGVTDYIARRGADLAAAGYVVLAPELYWRLDRHDIDPSDPAPVETAMGLASRLDWTVTVADATSALRHLRGREEVTGGAGVIGFCFGGGLAFNVAAVSDPDVLVSYYGSAIPGLLDLAPSVTCPSLHHFGLADSYIDNDAVEAVRRAVTAREAAQGTAQETPRETAQGTPRGPGRGRVRFETYAGADHAFDNSDFPLHHAEASAQAWRRTLDFLATALPVT